MPQDTQPVSNECRIHNGGLRVLNESLHLFSQRMGVAWRDTSESIFPVVDDSVRPIVMGRVNPEKAWTEWQQFQRTANEDLQIIFKEAANFARQPYTLGTTQNSPPFLPKGMTLRDVQEMKQARAHIDGVPVRLLNDSIRLSLDYLETIGHAINGPGLPQTREQFESFIKGGEASCQAASYILSPLRAIIRAHGGENYSPDDEAWDFNSRPRTPGTRPSATDSIVEGPGAPPEKVRQRAPADRLAQY